MEDLLEDLRIRFRDHPGAQIEVRELTQGPPLEATVAIKILARKLQDLQKISRDVEQLFEETPGLIIINRQSRTLPTTHSYGTYRSFEILKRQRTVTV